MKPMTRALCLCAALPMLAAGVVNAQQSNPHAAMNRAIARPKPMKIVPNPGKVYAGLYSIGSVAANYVELTGKSDGNTPGIVFTFHDWNRSDLHDPVQLQSMCDPMEGETLSPLEFAELISHEGSVLAIAWDAIGYLAEEPDYWAGTLKPPIRFDDIFDGVYDNHIRTVANQIKDFGKPIMLSPAAEFNSIGFVSFGPDSDQLIVSVDGGDLWGHYGDPALPDGPERMRDLFRHVIDIFNDEGVTNVTWFMYSQTAYMNTKTWDDGDPQFLDWLHPFFYYPGDEYIDWIGTSAYVSNDNPGHDLAFAIGPALDAFRAFTDKPYFIPEFGVIDAEGESRASRMRWLFEHELPSFPDVRAWAFADAELWAGYFGIPRLGNQPDEIPAWLDEVWYSGRYTNRILNR